MQGGLALPSPYILLEKFEADTTDCSGSHKSFTGLLNTGTTTIPSPESGDVLDQQVGLVVAGNPQTYNVQTYTHTKEPALPLSS